MATHGDLTVGKLKHYLSAYEDETRVVLGKDGTADVHWECHANSYYPPGREEEWPLVVIDVGDNK